jgi:hypothetical protein
MDLMKGDNVKQLDDHQLLTGLARILDEIIDEINNDLFVPDRYKSTVRDDLAESDVDTLRNAGNVLARLSRWAKWPSDLTPRGYVSRETADDPYTAPLLRIIDDIRKVK